VAGAVRPPLVMAVAVAHFVPGDEFTQGEDASERAVRGGRPRCHSGAAAEPSALGVRTGRLGLVEEGGALAVETMNKGDGCTTLNLSCADVPGVVHKVAAVVAASGNSVLGAEVVTDVHKLLAIDTFKVVREKTGEPLSADEQADLQGSLMRVLQAHTGGTRHHAHPCASLGVLNLQLLERETEDGECTVVQLRCKSRPGLLRDITSLMLELSICITSCTLSIDGGISAYEFHLQTANHDRLSKPLVNMLFGRMQTEATQLKRGRSLANMEIANQHLCFAAGTSPRGGSLSPGGEVAVETENTSEKCTKVTVTCADRRGVLHKLSEIFMVHNLCADKVEADTWPLDSERKLAVDCFHVSSQGRAVPAELHELLQNEIITALLANTGSTHSGKDGSKARFDFYEATASNDDLKEGTTLRLVCPDRVGLLRDLTYEFAIRRLSIATAALERQPEPGIRGEDLVCINLQIIDENGLKLAPLACSILTSSLLRTVPRQPEE